MTIKQGVLQGTKAELRLWRARLIQEHGARVTFDAFPVRWGHREFKLGYQIEDFKYDLPRFERWLTTGKW